MSAHLSLHGHLVVLQRVRMWPHEASAASCKCFCCRQADHHFRLRQPLPACAADRQQVHCLVVLQGLPPKPAGQGCRIVWHSTCLAISCSRLAAVRAAWDACKSV